MILIVDFGSQTTHLIGRRLRDLGVDSLVAEPSQVKSRLKEGKFAGLIFSGGPASVYDKRAPTIDQSVFKTDLPVLGICYGWQLMAQVLGGKVVAGQREYGPVELRREGSHKSRALLADLPSTFQAWMSHGDEVVSLPRGFVIIGKTRRVGVAAVAHDQKKWYGLQFHPEVLHTHHGTTIFKNFLEKICNLSTQPKTLDVNEVVKEVRSTINDIDNRGKILAAVSGGVDSTVAGAIVARAVGKRFVPIYCDNGLMRFNTTIEVKKIFTDELKVKLKIIRCQTRFLKILKGVTDPEQKRKLVGRLYIKIFEEVASSIEGARFLVQGTIYSDVIESQGTKHASKIKSHHNVGGLPKTMKLSLIEPLRNFYKDEVRELGRQLGLPETIVNKQPFPGPGYAIRILGEVTRDRLRKQKQADQIVAEVLRDTGWESKVFQAFPIMTGVNTTAVKGDGRSYCELVGLRVYDGQDIMTASWTRLPHDVLQQISSRIVNEVPRVSRVVYDITTKPPATMEWE